MSEGYLQVVSHGLPDRIRLWVVDLDTFRESMSNEGIPPGDLERARRMVPQLNADRFLACRSALYRILGEALGRDPKTLVLRRGTFGKPELADPALHFNVSHSGAKGLIGVSESLAVGVDIESIRGVDDAAAMAGEHFSAAELAAWKRASAATRDRKFLECWTRKEACLKALGTGLSFPLARVDVGFSERRPRTIQIPLDGASAEVTVGSLRIPGVTASVATASAGTVRLALQAAAKLSLPAPYIGPAG